MVKNSNLTLDKLSKKRKWYKEYKTTLNGYAHLVYSKQKFSSIQRQMPQPNYTLEEFKEWIGNQDRYWELRSKSQITGDRRIQPSVDRIDGSKPYTLDNLQILTLWNNLYVKGAKESVAGLKVWQNSPEGKKYLKKFAGKGKPRSFKMPMKELVCRLCGTHYKSNGARSYYCSSKCTKKAWKDKQIGKN